MVNQHRIRKGVPPLESGSNISAQVHAEISLENCHSSLWSSDGLEPGARYTLASGYQAMYIVAIGHDYCGDRDQKEYITRNEIREIIDDMLKPEDDWDEFDYSILEPLSDESYRMLNIGLTRDSHFTTAVLLMESDYVWYERLPTIRDGVLTFSGGVKNGATLDDERTLGAALSYHLPPRPLTQGQLARTYSGTSGVRVADLRRPAGEGYYWLSDSYTETYYQCRSPYDIDPLDAPLVQSEWDASRLHDEAREACRRIRYDKIGGVERTVPWVTADRWRVTNGSFDVSVDVSEVLNDHGRGIYTLLLWADGAGGERILVSEYAIFHGVVPTGVYSPR